MAKQGVKRMERAHIKHKNDASVAPEIQGKVNLSKERPISSAYTAVDTDLARDNFENDLPAADLENL